MSVVGCCRATEYGADWSACAFRHRIAERQIAPSRDDLWSEAAALFDTLPGVCCADIRSGRAAVVRLDLPEDDGTGAESDADTGNTGPAAEEARQQLLQRARRVHAHAQAPPAGPSPEVVAAARAARAAGILPDAGSDAEGTDVDAAADGAGAPLREPEGDACAQQRDEVMADPAGADACAGVPLDAAALSAVLADGVGPTGASMDSAAAAEEAAGSGTAATAADEAPEERSPHTEDAAAAEAADERMQSGGDTDMEEPEDEQAAAGVPADAATEDPGNEAVEASPTDTAKTLADTGAGEEVGTDRALQSGADECLVAGEDAAVEGVDEVAATDDEEHGVADGGAAVDADVDNVCAAGDDGDDGAAADDQAGTAVDADEADEDTAAGGGGDGTAADPPAGGDAAADAAEADAAAEEEADESPADGLTSAPSSPLAAAGAHSADLLQQPAAESGLDSSAQDEVAAPCDAGVSGSGAGGGAAERHGAASQGPEPAAGAGHGAGGALFADESAAAPGSEVPAAGDGAVPGGGEGDDSGGHETGGSMVAPLLEAAQEPEPHGPHTESGPVSPDLGPAPLPDPLSAGTSEVDATRAVFALPAGEAAADDDPADTGVAAGSQVVHVRSCMECCFLGIHGGSRRRVDCMLECRFHV